MRTGVSYQLRRGIEAHRLAVEQAGEEGIGVVALEPAAGVGEEREAGGVALGEAVFAEAFDLLEDALGEVPVVAVLRHAVDEIVMEFADVAAALPRGHRAAQPVGLALGEVGREDGDLHHLLLEDGHAFRASEGDLELAGVFDLVVGKTAVLQVGVHHAALDGPRPHDRHFDHQVVVHTGPQPRQHAHLRAALDLEDAHGVGGADHVPRGVGLAVRELVHLDRPAQLARQEFERTPERAQHAEREDVDLHQAQRFEVVLFPLDDASVGHRGVFDRHQLRHLLGRNDEATRVLAQMTRRADELVRELKPEADERRLRVEAARAQALVFDAHVEPLHALGDGLDALQVDAKRTAHVAQGRARAVADDDRGERGAMAAVFGVDVLDDFFAALVLEVDVDVGGLVALVADEPAEEQLGATLGVHLGHAQAEADQ